MNTEHILESAEEALAISHDLVAKILTTARYCKNSTLGYLDTDEFFTQSNISVRIMIWRMPDHYWVNVYRGHADNPKHQVYHNRCEVYKNEDMYHTIHECFHAAEIAHKLSS